ncbi:carboxylating nicotinate-nucleotide diphosphorylase [Deinococcus roseus]|uniref:nicotinate-nucleotide diphosphorylase (carboxylating) n=1 Tax=Deinococcus roseus TaxID=392414 RepID=A0ABQ2CTU4_9DEIO|nr:carboxylating nicotinate-nucleotide diphosphorylase [Deinococcus roseus]GGJ20227.1 nicotinate-nucleotide diphosphorylase (carboxylating) [Deinococcus roseus]
MLGLAERLKYALQEDIGRGDVTTLSTVPAGQQGIGFLKLKSPGVVFGLEVAREVFHLVDPNLQVNWDVQDGSDLQPQVLGKVTGSMQSILLGERLALNLMQRLSGVATLTKAFVNALGDSNTKVLDTRKTTPLWRDLEKAAVRAAGGVNHRFGLDDGLLIKDNHVVAAGGVQKAIQAAKERFYLIKIECEVESLEQLREAIGSGADRIMLDNMDDQNLQEAVRIRNELNPQISLEASGNMTIERLGRIKNFGLDFVSVGALTHSATSLDISLDVRLA